MNTEKRVFLCSFCGAKITNNKANLERHEALHKPTVQKIRCSAEECVATFKRKADYYRHWNTKHSNTNMPDGLKYVTEENTMYKLKYRNTQSNTSASNTTYTPKYNDFLVLNYLGLFENRTRNINLEYPIPDPSFGKMVNDY